ncbi:Transcription initiation factor TFIID subunit 12 [Ciborinia camelliae]|nr:Transcription initiation factor TFIID subunit 12 [Ciborinia camelliae]
MNNGSQGQAPQGQPGASQPAPPRIYKPEMMRNLPPGFSDEEKLKWETGLRGLWAQVENNPAESPQHQEAKRKLADFSRQLIMKIQTYRTQQQRQVQQAQQAQQQQGQGQQVQQNQPTQPTQQAQQTQQVPQQAQQVLQQSQQQAPQPTSAPSSNPAQQHPALQQHEQTTQSQETQASGSNAGSSSQQQPRAQAAPQLQEKLLQHIKAFPWTAPPNLIQNSAERNKWLSDLKQKYAKGLMAMDSTTSQLKNLEEYIKKKREERTATEQDETDYQTRMTEFRNKHAMAKKFVEEIRENQKRLQQQNSQHQGQQQHPQQSQASGSGPSDSNVIGNAGGIGNQSNQGVQGTQMNQAQGAPRPLMNSQQPSNPALQNTQTVNAAIEQARNQQMGGVNRPPMPQGQLSQGQQIPTPIAASHPAIPQSQTGQSQGIKSEPTIPGPINTAITHMQNNMARPGQTNSPQSSIPQSSIPQSATSINAQNPGPPRALTHQAALQTAAQSYSSAGGQATGTPTVMGHSHTHPHVMSREQQNPSSQKLPIPKHLPERAMAPPQPVQMGQPRPTYTGGPSGAGNGVMGQPVLPKAPGYVLDGEGDRVLSKKKLDELVRQVTGGGENIAGGGLTAEVEESILTVADNFVDQVLQAACKNAKERGSKILEIRDLQLTLERGYNIRIPGYASDEIRTVRKIAPSSGWINKMSAVQAAKVTGGKGSD